MNCFDLKLTEFSALSVGGKNPNLGHYAHYVPTVASTMQYPPKDPIHARFTYQDDGTVQQLGMISHKKSLITIFGHKHKINYKVW